MWKKTNNEEQFMTTNFHWYFESFGHFANLLYKCFAKFVPTHARPD